MVMLGNKPKLENQSQAGNAPLLRPNLSRLLYFSKTSKIDDVPVCVCMYITACFAISPVHICNYYAVAKSRRQNISTFTLKFKVLRSRSQIFSNIFYSEHTICAFVNARKRTSGRPDIPLVGRATLAQDPPLLRF
jgi:hypothetical protein